jgi:hypothetical protein
MRNAHATRTIALGILLALAGCSSKTANTSSDSSNSSTAASNSAASGSNAASQSDAANNAPAPAPPPPVVIDAGKTLAVSIDQEISTKTNNDGDHFEASLAAPVLVNGSEVLPKGTHVRGVVTQSAEAGHVKGNAVLTIKLDSISSNGQSYAIHATSYTTEGKARGKRTGIGAGGGAAFGAIVGAIAGGGKGAAIGAAAGGGAGTAGAAATGDRDVAIPAETVVHFKLTQPVSLSQ